MKHNLRKSFQEGTSIAQTAQAKEVFLDLHITKIDIIDF